MSLTERLKAPGPKRILALDGGGVRGALTLGYLERMEAILAAQHGDPAFRLSDYFDLVGGTSTGSILASCVATGLKVSEIKQKFFEVIHDIFGKKYSQWMVLPGKGAQKMLNVLFSKADYDSTPIENALKMMFGDITLGSDAIKTGLCIVAKRADTNSTWPLINHPDGKYFDSAFGTNKDIPLWKAVRASAAAPTYFIPQVINVGGGSPDAVFVDGGMSMANNPALQTLMVATLRGFPFRWQMGAGNLMVVSIGTGVNRYSKQTSEITAYQQFKWASQIPEMLMQDASWTNQTILQWLSSSATGWQIDSEVGDLSEDVLCHPDSPKGFITYLRYNTWLAKDDLEKLMSKPYTDDHVNGLIEMDRAENSAELYDIACAAAKNEMQPGHFPETFRLPAYAGLAAT